ncbi:hypothetical protein MUA31_09965 [Staphylococcus simulans]|uniref:hypothetical protein n=1 Tax=Staphylococcus simulans TaxID=1286 RepID=UPI0021CF283F|nr:hypothetical protein [Staphylococcus simulans]UXR34704.1 hypothetical protein MUA31_09965 [Staphylococcus simulans]
MKLFNLISRSKEKLNPKQETVSIPIDEFEKIQLKLKLLGDYLKWFDDDYFNNSTVNIKKMVYQLAEQRDKIESFITIITQIHDDLGQKKTASHDQAKAE